MMTRSPRLRRQGRDWHTIVTQPFLVIPTTSAETGDRGPLQRVNVTVTRPIHFQTLFRTPLKQKIETRADGENWKILSEIKRSKRRLGSNRTLKEKVCRVFQLLSLPVHI